MLINGYSHRKSPEITCTIYDASSGPSNTYRDPSQPNSYGIKTGEHGRAIFDVWRGRQATKHDSKFIITRSSHNRGNFFEELSSRDSVECSTEPVTNARRQKAKVSDHYDGGVLLLNGQSDEISDKENDDLSNPKKRAKAQVPPQNIRLQPDQVLSPRSANSRTLPRSPVRPALSPGKSYLARPVSPLKPMGPTATGGAAGILTNMVEKAKSTRATAARKTVASSSASSTAGAGAGRGKKAPQAATAKAGKGRASNSSQSTDASSGTTVVTKTAPTKSPVKKTVMSTIKGMGGTATKKPAATKAAPTRVLRKRT